jgi:8-oxo-dGTP pyrophosphatase MutT (NUDIX family)
MDDEKDIIEKTLKREVMEEVGIEIEDEIIFVGDEGFYRVSGHHVVGMTFLCKWKKGVARPLEGQEEVRWFTKRQLRDFQDLPEYFRPRVEKVLQILG